MNKPLKYILIITCLWYSFILLLHPRGMHSPLSGKRAHAKVIIKEFLEENNYSKSNISENELIQLNEETLLEELGYQVTLIEKERLISEPLVRNPYVYNLFGRLLFLDWSKRNHPNITCNLQTQEFNYIYP